VRRHQRQLRGADEPVGLGGVPGLHHDEVGAAEHVVEGGHPGDAGEIAGIVRVVGEQPAAEARQPRRELPADVSEADHADGPPGDLDARAGEVFAPAAGHDRRVRPGDVARLGQHEPDLQFGDRGGVAPVHRHHPDAEVGGGADVDVLQAGAGDHDEPEPVGGGQDLLTDRREVQAQRPGPGQRRDQLRRHRYRGRPFLLHHLL
jgi:hypothetical protein